MHLRCSLVVAGVVATAAARAQDGPSLDRVLSHPHVYELTAAPGASGKAAFAVLERGARGIYVVDAKLGRAKRVAHWPGDGGQNLAELEWSVNGRTLAFVRGEGGNAQRVSPNPTSDPAGAEQAVWASADGAPARRLGLGSRPAVSPDGGWVSFEHDSTIYVAPANASTPAKPLFSARGINHDATWSSDGHRVAFVSARGDHSFVGVYDRASNAITWMAPGVDRDELPRWSGDGKAVAFVRTNGGARGGNFILPAGSAGFGLWVADATTGEARQLWHSPAGPGGRLRQPSAAGTQFLWVGAHLVFITEADGWQHIYAIATDGSSGEPKQLTHGSCEDEDLSPAADGRTLYYSSNCEDIDRKHVWRIVVDGSSAPVRVTGGALPSRSIEWQPAVSGDHLLVMRSDWRVPVAVMRVTTQQPGVQPDVQPVAGAPAFPADFPFGALVEPQPVTFKAADGLEVHGQLFVPRGLAGGKKAPAVIFMHGGPARQMLLGWNKSEYYNRAYGYNQWLASKGYVVLSINYRLGVGYGREFREAARGGRYGASEYQDIVAGGKFLQALPAVDGARIGLWGGSYGGYLTAYGMARNPELFKAGVDLHGVHDWNARFSSFAPATVAGGREPDSVLAIGRASSPVCCVKDIQGPMLFVHGDDDRNVSFSETVNLVQMMRAEGKKFELLVFPDDVHDFLRFSHWMKAFKAGGAFLDKVLVRGEPIAAR